MDNITPQEFAKQMGAYPNAPYNPTPVGGYMDEGFNWVMGAESFDAETEYKLCDGCEEMRSIRDFSYSNDPQQTLTESEVCDYCFGDLIDRINDAESFDAEEKCPMPNYQGKKCGKGLYSSRLSPRASIGRKTRGMKICGACAGLESYAKGLGEWVDKYPNRRHDAETFNADSQDKKFCIGCGTPSGYPHSLEKLPYQVGLDGKQAYSCRDCFDEVREAESFNAESKRCSYCKTENLEDFAGGWDDYCMKCARRHRKEYGAESLSEIEGPTAEATAGGLHSPSSFDITWEDGTGQSSASMPPNEIHFGGEGSKPNFPQIMDVECAECDNPMNMIRMVWTSPTEWSYEYSKDYKPSLSSYTHTNYTKEDTVNFYDEDDDGNPLCDDCHEDVMGAEEGYDFQKMTPSPYTPFDQIGNELQQQRMESGPMLEPTNANFSAESRPISEDGELLAIYDDMGEHKGFIEMEDDLEDDSIEIDITDDEMNDIAEVRLDSEVVGNPSPSSPLEEVPATVPSPAEPTNSNFSAEKKTDYITMILGTAALVVGSGMFAKSQGWLVTDTKAADTDDLPSIDPTVNDGLVASPSTGDLLPADYEEMVVESTGYAVPIIPISLDPSFMGSRFQALPTDRLVDSNEPGIGAHTDVAMYRDTLYREPEQSMVQAPSLNAEGECNCSILDKIMAFFKGEECSCETEVKESQGVGQTPYFGFGFERKNPQQRVIKETGPISLDPSVTSYLPQNLSGYTGQAYRPPTIYGDMMGLGMAGASVPFVNPNESTVGANRYGSNPVDSSTLQSIHGNLSSSTNASYTNGSKTMSLAQWSIDYDVSQTSDSEAFAVSRSSGIRTMIRRV